ncbi:MAG: GNAT family N-acetyltransferase [Acidimicrobiales bacterium]
MTVVDNASERRFEISAGGQLAHLDYRLDGERLVIVHTAVPMALRDHGLGGQLVEAAVEAALTGGLTVVPACSFARSWLGKHPELAAGVEIDWE